LRVFKAFGRHHFLEIQGFLGLFIFLGKAHWVPLRLTHLFHVRLVTLKLPSLKNLLDCFQPLKRFWIWLEVILHLGGVLAAQAYQSPRRRFASL
jgi:predicted membrane channel-forming protein YqfA (hemolysin III family)